jgi:hypothetical protein
MIYYLYEKNGRKRKASSIQCSYCNQPFLKATTKITNGANYCSRKCSSLGYRKRQTVKCDACGNELIKPQGRVKAFNFCNRVCQSLAQKKNHSSPYRCFVRDEITVGTYRRTAISLYGCKCETCGVEDIAALLDVHHVDENKKNNYIDNLIVLCVRCHAKITRGVAILINRTIQEVGN